MKGGSVQSQWPENSSAGYWESSLWENSSAGCWESSSWENPSAGYWESSSWENSSASTRRRRLNNLRLFPVRNFPSTGLLIR